MNEYSLDSAQEKFDVWYKCPWVLQENIAKSQCNRGRSNNELYGKGTVSDMIFSLIYIYREISGRRFEDTGPGS